MHRVRQALPYLRACGWEPTVLAVRPDEVQAPIDPLLLQTVPDDVRVVRTGAVPLRWTRLVGVGQLDARSLLYLARAGDALFREAPFDLVFFSTTALDVSVLGLWWKRRYGTPFVVDIQDPWVNPYYNQNGMTPPGGRFKYGAVSMTARYLEPRVLRRASRVVSVSASYLESFAERYPWFSEERGVVLPFGAPERDFAALERMEVRNPVFDPADGLEHWVYVGAAGEIMRFALTALFTAIRRAREANPERFERVRLHFVGTAYAPEGRAKPTVAPIAAQCGVADLVEERTGRIPYFEALQVLSDANALVVPGSDDPGYTASKLYPYVLARRPLLAVFHEASSVVDIVRRTKAGVVVPFASGEAPEAVAERIVERWLSRPLPVVKTDWEAFEPYTARAMTRQLADVFSRSAGARRSVPSAR